MDDLGGAPILGHLHIVESAWEIFRDSFYVGITGFSPSKLWKLGVSPIVGHFHGDDDVISLYIPIKIAIDIHIYIYIYINIYIYIYI